MGLIGFGLFMICKCRCGIFCCFICLVLMMIWKLFGFFCFIVILLVLVSNLFSISVFLLFIVVSDVMCFFGMISIWIG